MALIPNEWQQFKTLKLQSPAPGVVLLTIHRPESLNALNQQVLQDLGDFLIQIKAMPFEQVRALVITGSGDKAFVAGADIKEISELKPESAVDFARRGQSVFSEIGNLKIPVIAAVNGFALGGGCELALACDFIYAAENAKFGLPEVSLGIIPGFGGTVRLSQAVGLRKAREMIFSGEMVVAAEALRIGLVNKVLPQAELLLGVYAHLTVMMTRSSVAIAAAKKSVATAYDQDLESGNSTEAHCFGELFAHGDVREGTRAFIEKRKPQFKG